ncbi:MAG: DNA recombination protein RmuC [Spirochaetes bacterium]|jgi:DNA recombination protein RmuC|nr:DNA recombination protein RmuC [Spirochaetota bacterium]
MQMQFAIIALLSLTVIIAVIAVVILLKNRNPDGSTLNQQMLDVKNQLVEMKTRQLESQNRALAEQQSLFNTTQRTLNEQLGNIINAVNDNLAKTQSNITSQLNSTGAVVGDIHKKLGTLEETAKNIQDIGRDISSLQDILQAPKLRGNLGEYLLGELLKQIFPRKNYEMQYSFKNGLHVDAVIRIGDGLVPVDSKFPLESFQRLIATENEEEKTRYKREFIKAVKARIDEISSKYICPEEGTFDFAMMYIPAENVFYEVIINDAVTGREYEIFNYAIGKHVIPVSPNSFYAYLMAIVFGLKGFRIEQQAKTIMNELSRVQTSFSAFYREFELVGKHIENASSKYSESARKAEKFNEKVSQITGVRTDLIESKNQ